MDAAPAATGMTAPGATEKHRVLVTGAGGFVGSFLAECLGEKGLEVRGASRAGPGIAVGDLGPSTDWSRALEGVQTVIHLAARVHQLKERSPHPAAEFLRVNAQGACALAQAAAARGVRRFVFVSTVQIHGRANPGPEPLTEDSPARPADDYARSKWEAETLLRDVASRTGLELVTLRPPLVYGPGKMKGNLLRLLDGIRRELVFPIGSFANARSLIGLDNLACALYLCAIMPEAAGQSFLVRDGEDVSTAELIRKIAAAMGKRARIISLPKPVLNAVGALLPPVGRALKRLGDSLTIDDSKIRRALDWRPVKSLDEGIQEMVFDYISRQPWRTR